MHVKNEGNDVVDGVKDYGGIDGVWCGVDLGEIHLRCRLRHCSFTVAQFKC